MITTSRSKEQLSFTSGRASRTSGEHRQCSCDHILILKPTAQTCLATLAFVGLRIVFSRKYQPSDSMAEETRQPCSQTGSCQSRLAEPRLFWGWDRGFYLVSVQPTSYCTRPPLGLTAVSQWFSVAFMQGLGRIWPCVVQRTWALQMPQAEPPSTKQHR